MKNLALAVLAGLSLSACVTVNAPIDGTGNNGNTVTQYPVETALLNIYTKARSQTLTTTIDNQQVVAEVRVTPKGTVLFEGKQLQSAEVNTLNKTNNQLINQSVSINYFSLNPLVFYGYTDASGNYSVASQASPIPKRAQVGNSGLLITENVYSDSSKHNKTALYSQSWALTQDSNNTAWLCINTSANMLVDYDANGTTAECYKINAKGDILSSKLTLKMPTQTINFVSS